MEFRQFGPYRIESLLGQGGMGEVYRAFDTEQDREVALKVLPEHLAADHVYRERFRREAHLAARLNEPHIVPTHRFGEIDGRLFLDMRLVHGRDAAAVLAQEGRFQPVRAVSIINQVARALDSAHADGLVHRDVKPSNVLLTGEGDDEFVYLVDFGIARSTSDTSWWALTQAGAALGTFDYMAPERFLEMPIDKRVDVYSLACVLFECLTGSRPFSGDDLATLISAHVNTEAPAPSSLRPDLPRALDKVVLRGLAKDPDDRYASAGELAAGARKALQGPGVMPKREVQISAAPPTVIGHLPLTPSGGGLGHPGPPGRLSEPSSRSTVRPLPSRKPTAGTPPGPSRPSRPSGPPGRPGGDSAPRGDRRRKSGPFILTTALVVAVMSVVWIVAHSGADGGNADGSTANPTANPSAAPEDQLLALVPGDFNTMSCQPRKPAGDGDLAAVDCGAGRSNPAPTESRFYLYPDSDTLDRGFMADATLRGQGQLGADQDCPTSQGYRVYTDSHNRRAGRVACYVDPGNNAVMIWTREDVGVEGIVAIGGGGPDGLAELWEWWRRLASSDFGG